MSKGLFGDYWVTPTATALTRAWKLVRGSVRDYQVIRRHALKLAHWPGGNDRDARQSTDLDWDWVRGLENEHIGEVRIDEIVAGHDNLRLIFYKADSRLANDPIMRIWILTVFQKKRQGFTANQLRAWRAMRQVIVHREYAKHMR